MKGIFVNEDGGVRYAWAIVGGLKTIETRSRNMLSALVGERVAIIRTHRHSNPIVLGYATISGSSFCKAADFQRFWTEHLVPVGSQYDATDKGKWFYHMTDAERCTPYPLPSSAVRHGRSWCEWEVMA